MAERVKRTAAAACTLLMTVLLWAAVICAPAYAEGTYRAALSDYDDSLTDVQENELLALMQQTANKIECNVGVVITSDLNGKSDYGYADDFLDDTFGFGSSSIVLLFANNQSNPNYGDWISTGGRARDYYDNSIDYIFDTVYNGLDSGGFGKAIQNYCNYLSNHSSSFDIDMTLDSYTIAGFLVPVIIGLVLSLSIVGGICKGYKKKNPISAASYIDNGRTKYLRRDDIFVREFTTSHHVSSSSGGHRGGRGGSHGGGGGSHRSGGHGGGGGRHR